jgi:hypothetical protein
MSESRKRSGNASSASERRTLKSPSVRPAPWAAYGRLWIVKTVATSRQYGLSRPSVASHHTAAPVCESWAWTTSGFHSSASADHRPASEKKTNFGPSSSIERP